MTETASEQKAALYRHAVYKYLLVPEGKEVLVCGAGLVGCEVALFLAEKGKKVTMIDQLSEHAPAMPIYAKWVLNSRLCETHVNIQTSKTIQSVEKGRVICRDADGKEAVYTGDAIVLALGLSPTRGFAEALRKADPSIRIISPRSRSSFFFFTLYRLLHALKN